MKSRNNRVSKQVVVQRLLPLQPGITQPYSVLATTDVNYNGATVENTIIKPVATGLTKENLDRMNNLSNNIEPSTSTENGNSKLDITDDDADVVKNCDIVDAGNDGPLLSSVSETDQIDSDEEENNRIRQKFNEDPGIQSLMEISLPSPIPMVNVTEDCKHFV